MEVRRTNGGDGQDYAFWRGDMWQLWVFVIDYLLIVGGATLAVIFEDLALVAWVLLVGLLIVAWLIAVVTLVPRTAPSGRQHTRGSE